MTVRCNPLWRSLACIFFGLTSKPVIDVDRECIKVTLVVIPTDGVPPPPPSSTTFSTSTTSASSTSTGTVPTPTGPPFTDMTALGWRYVGCAPEERWTDDGAFRTLPDAMTSSDDDMTNEACLAFCDAQGFRFAGTEWSRECWCANAYAPTRQPADTLASLAACDYPCTGDAAQFCGGDSWLSLYAKCPAEGPCENTVFT